MPSLPQASLLAGAVVQRLERGRQRGRQAAPLGGGRVARVAVCGAAEAVGVRRCHAREVGPPDDRRILRHRGQRQRHQRRREERDVQRLLLLRDWLARPAPRSESELHYESNISCTLKEGTTVI